MTTIDLDALERALDDPGTIAVADIDALLAIARAAQEAGPWPLWIHTVDHGYNCQHCHGWHPESFEEVQHGPTCSGIRLRDALAVITGGAA